MVVDYLKHSDIVKLLSSVQKNHLDHERRDLPLSLLLHEVEGEERALLVVVALGQQQTQQAQLRAFQFACKENG